MPLIALFGPTGVGKTAVAVALAASAARAGRAPGRGLGRRAAGLRRPRDAHRRRHAGGARRARAPPRLIPAGRRDVQRGAVRAARARRDRRAARRRAPADRRRRNGPVPARRAHGSRPAPAAAPGAARALDRRARRARALPRCTRGSQRLAPWAAERIDPGDRQRIVRALELLELGALEPPGAESQLWSEDMRHPTLLAGLTMERSALYARIDARVDAMVAAGAAEEVRAAHAAGASRPPARRSASRSCSRATSSG